MRWDIQDVRIGSSAGIPHRLQNRLEDPVTLIVGADKLLDEAVRRRLEEQWGDFA